MDTSELEKYMLNDPCIASLYGGVVPKDILPEEVQKPKLYIVNLDESSKKGSHWISLFLLNNAVSEYFDPLGHSPDTFVEKYMEKQSTCYLSNVKQCQSSFSNSCGKLCLFYCYFRSRGKSLGEILDYFKNNVLYNEAFILYLLILANWQKVHI